MTCASVSISRPRSCSFRRVTVRASSARLKSIELTCWSRRERKMLTSPALFSMVSSSSASTRAISARSAGATCSRPGRIGALVASSAATGSPCGAGHVGRAQRLDAVLGQALRREAVLGHDPRPDAPLIERRLGSVRVGVMRLGRRVLFVVLLDRALGREVRFGEDFRFLARRQRLGAGMISGVAGASSSGAASAGASSPARPPAPVRRAPAPRPGAAAANQGADLRYQPRGPVRQAAAPPPYRACGPVRRGSTA